MIYITCDKCGVEIDLYLRKNVVEVNLLPLRQRTTWWLLLPDKHLCYDCRIAYYASKGIY